MQLQLTNR